MKNADRSYLALCLIAVLAVASIFAAAALMLHAGDDGVAPSTLGIAGQPKIYELAYISDFGVLGDNSVNAAAWDGLSRCASDFNVGAAHYPPRNQSVGAYMEAIGAAISGGAKLVAVAGALFETPVWLAQSKYPDIRFLLIDGTPHDEDYTDDGIGPNTAVIGFDTAQAGFLAGYAAVRGGCRRIGFIGAMPTPEIANAGFGFAQGADFAAVELGLAKGEVDVNYAYAGTFLARPEVQILAGEWFDSNAGDTRLQAATAAEGDLRPAPGIELIFAFGGESEYGVALAAQKSGGQVILYDNVNDYKLPSIAAVIKRDYAKAVYECAASHMNGAYPGGAAVICGVGENAIWLGQAGDGDTRHGQAGESDARHWQAGEGETRHGQAGEGGLSLSQADLDAIAALIASGQIEIIRADANPYTPTSPTNLPLSIAQIKE